MRKIEKPRTLGRTGFRIPFSRPLLVWASWLWIATTACHGGATEDLPASQTKFEDQTAQLGLELKGSAACWVDVDGDGWTDIVCGGTYWKNCGGEKFERKQDGLGSVVAADFDNDGFPDLFSFSQLKLFHNEQGQKFLEIPLPEFAEHISRGACWGDFNRDGFVDIYVGGYEDWERGITFPNLLLLNREGKTFEIASVEASARTRGVTACDFDRQNGLDIYVSNYRLMPNQLLINSGNGDLSDQAGKYQAAAGAGKFTGGHTIGSAWGDLDNDGWMDLFVGNFAHRDRRGDQPQSRVLRNPGKPGQTFEDLGECGVFYQESYASPALGDYDNDGDLDLFLTTVYEVASFGKPNHAVLFEQRKPFQFVDVVRAANLGDLPPTYQAAWGDCNNDGQLDLITAGKLFVNQGSDGHWLKIKLNGDGKSINRSAVGSQVRLKLGNEILVRQVEAGTGEGNQNALTLHFGLGSHATPVDVVILWPDGTQHEFQAVEINRLHQIDYPEGKEPAGPPSSQ